MEKDEKKLRKFLTVISIMVFSLICPVFAEDVPYGIGSWDADSLGSHRAVVRVSIKADAVRVHIPWRRRDFNPEKKNIIIIDAKTGARIENLWRVEINREFGDLVFQPKSIPGDYYIYYLPYTVSGSRNYPKVNYPEPKDTAKSAWIQRNGLAEGSLTDKGKKELPEAHVLEIQAVDEFNSFYPMELTADSREMNSLLERYPKSSYLLFPEDRKFPIRMTDDIPSKWIKTGPQDTFEGDALRGEFYAFQIGIYACRKAIENIDVRFSSMKCRVSDTCIPASALHCFNTGGIDSAGKEFKKKCSVEKGKIQALWCGVQIPADAKPGKYEGQVTVVPKGMEPGKIKIVLNVGKEMLKDAGDSEPWRHSRLRWLDSMIAFDDTVVAPFTPMSVKNNVVSCLGRRVAVGKTGFPVSIKSLFAPEMTRLTDVSREILSSPVDLIVENVEGDILSWIGGSVEIIKRSEGAIAWQSQSKTGPLKMDCRAQMEFDGCIEFCVTISTSKTLKVRDIRLEVPLVKNIARYMMGMGFKGGYRPAEYSWKWERKNNQDSVWIGDVNAGLQCSFKDENYIRPLNTNFYLSKPLNMPPSWWNEGKGGCNLKEAGEDTFLISAYSGNRTIEEGEELHFNFRLLLTPFKMIDEKAQWNTRFYHSFKPPEEIAATGANTINVHHATEINPYINYPFLRPEKMRAYIHEAHQLGLKVKIYYTVRELSNHAPEIFALRSLGDEILSYGPGGGFSWLQEHLGSNYIAAWFVPKLKDAAVINSGVSRWHNYYVEGLNWLVKNVGIDGLYIDDVAFDRTTMKRVRKILDRGSKGALIDLHSANQFNVRDGFANSANLYLEHFPYLNRLWFGEYFDYDSSPDFWLVEISGIPFGVMGEMLQDGGNAWRGMLYGMTSRLPWAGDPTHIWKVWDNFGIQDSQMLGYWVPSCPVKTDNEDVLATVYVKKDKVLVSLASWAKETVHCRLNIDWNALGLDPKKAKLYAPGIESFQSSVTFKPGGEIPVEPGKGWLLVLSE